MNKTCACCGTPAPAPERIQPMEIQMEQTFSRGPEKAVIGQEPSLILWRCPGALEVDEGLLRFGIIALAPWSCGNVLATPWKKTTFDLRRRAAQTQQIRFALAGMI